MTRTPLSLSGAYFVVLHFGVLHHYKTIVHVREVCYVLDGKQRSGECVIDNVSIGIMTAFNTLLQRYGIKPGEVVATLERTNESGEFAMHFCLPEKEHLTEPFDRLLTALGLPQDGTDLEGSGDALYTRLESALDRAPRRRTPPSR